MNYTALLALRIMLMCGLLTNAPRAALQNQDTYYFVKAWVGDNGGIYAGNDNGEARLVLAQDHQLSFTYPSDIAFDGTDFYVLYNSGADGYHIIRNNEFYPIADFFFRETAEVDVFAGIAVDSVYIYAPTTGGGSSGTNGILAISKKTESATVLYDTGAWFPMDVEVMGGSVYWSAHHESGQTYAVFKDGMQISANLLRRGDCYPPVVGIDVLQSGRVFAIGFIDNDNCAAAAFEVLQDGSVSVLQTHELPLNCFEQYGVQDIEIRETPLGLEIYTSLGESTISRVCKGATDGTLEDSLQCNVSPALALVEGPPSGAGSASLTIPLGGTFCRVDPHGLPMPEKSPTDREEVDRHASSIYADAYSLQAFVCTSDAIAPIEGGDLQLEFRRVASVSSRSVTSIASGLPITYSSDTILGAGWDCNLSGHLTLSRSGPLRENIATVVDDVGTRYRYLDSGLTGEATPFSPETYYSFNNQAERAKLWRADANTLVLAKTFGTRVTYQRLGSFFPPAGGEPEEYFRIARVEDRNGNAIVYQYLSDDPLSRESFLVAALLEEAHHERRIDFAYEIGTGGNGGDWGDRLVSMTDALGRVTNYEYGPSGGFDEQFLTAVVREPVLDGESGATLAPRTEFTYRVADLAVEEAIDPASPPAVDPLTKNHFVALASVRDPRGHVTEFHYGDGYFPSSIAQGLNPNLYGLRPHLTSLRTDDGLVTFERLNTTHESLATRVTDTRGNQTTYQFTGSAIAASNVIGKALHVTSLVRTSPIGTVEYRWSGDAFANLLEVADLNGNTIEYRYSTETARRSDQPTEEIATDAGSGASHHTSYDYGVHSRLQGMTDAEGMATSHVLDLNGNRRRINGELGSSTQYGFASDGFVEAVTDPDGRRTEYTRSFVTNDPANYYRVTESVEGYNGELSLVTVRTFDAMGHLVRLVDPNGNEYHYKYDSLYRLKERIEPVSGSATTTFTLNGDPVSATDFLGNVVTLEYDSMNRVKRERRPESIVTSMTYGPAGELLSRTDPEGTVFEYSYDEALRLVRTDLDTGGLNFHEVREYGDNSGSGAFAYTDGYQPTRLTDRRGNHTDLTYDGFYRPTQVIHRFSPTTGHGAPPQAADSVTEHVYNKVNNEIRTTLFGETDAGGNRVTYSVYDALHRKVGSAVDLDGDGGPYGGASGIVDATFTGDAGDQVTALLLDLKGNQVGVVDAEGHLTETVFDGASRPVLVRQPEVEAGTPITLTEYDDNSNAVLVTDPRGSRTLITYDGRNRETVRILDLNGDGIFSPSVSGKDIVVTKVYDLMDNIVATTDSRGNTTAYVYDEAYRQTQRVEPEVADPEDGNTPTHPTWTIDYDKKSRRILETDPRLVRKAYSYDGLDRPREETSAYGTADAVTTSFEYDASDNVIARSLGNGIYGVQRTEFAYDALNRQTLERRPGGLDVTFEYYRNGLEKRRTDPKGQVREHKYDAAGRAIRSTFMREDGSVEEERLFVYDKANHPTLVQDRHGSSAIGYDALYRQTSETRTYTHALEADPFTYGVANAYDLNGNLVTTTYPLTARVVRRSFDRANRLSAVVDQGRPKTAIDDITTAYTYDANGNALSVLYPNGARATSAYDALDRAFTRIHERQGKPVYQARYVYDLAGNRLRIDEKVDGHPGRVLTYGYDAQYRLKREGVGDLDTLYVYDLAGNRLAKLFKNTITKYTYNTRNELEVCYSGPSATSYAFDPNGNLISRTDASGTTEYTWDTSDRLTGAFENGDQVFEARYDYRSRRLVKDEGDGPTFFVYSGGLALEELSLADRKLQVEYVHGLDMGGGVGATLYGVRPGTGSGRTRQPAKYEFFVSNHLGHTVALTNGAGRTIQTELFDAFGDSVARTGDSVNTRRAYTKERDAALGFDNHGYRYYDPATGRYISLDPAGYVDGLNRYLHTANNPVNRYDPKGLFWGFVVDAASAAYDTYQVASGGITWREYSVAMAITGASIAANSFTAGTGGLAVRAAATAHRAEQGFGAARAGWRAAEAAEVAAQTARGVESRVVQAEAQAGTRLARGELVRGSAEGTAEGALKGVGDVPSSWPLAAGEAGKGAQASLWTKAEFNGTRVYQRNDLIDPAMIDARGRSNLQRMQQGLAPIGHDGKAINLHHTIQTADSPLAEMTATFHRENSRVMHTNPNTFASDIDRAAFDSFRRAYWLNRAQDYAR